MKTVYQNYTFNPKKFGKKLKDLREEKGYTQQEIADKLGLVSGNSISAYESGKSFPREENLYTLSRIYATSLDFLLGRDERKEDAYRNEVIEVVTKNDSDDVVIEADLEEEHIELMNKIINQLSSSGNIIGVVDENDTIGGRLKRLRLINEASMKDISEMTGISIYALSMLENNKNKPSVDSLLLLAELYNVSTDYILGLEKETTSCDTTGLNFHQKKLISDLIEAFRKTNRGGGNF